MSDEEKKNENPEPETEEEGEDVVETAKEALLKTLGITEKQFEVLAMDKAVELAMLEINETVYKWLQRFKDCPKALLELTMKLKIKIERFQENLFGSSDFARDLLKCTVGLHCSASDEELDAEVEKLRSGERTIKGVTVTTLGDILKVGAEIESGSGTREEKDRKKAEMAKEHVEEMREAIAANWSYDLDRTFEIEFSPWGNQSVSMGAAGLFVEKLFSVPDIADRFQELVGYDLYEYILARKEG